MYQLLLSPYSEIFYNEWKLNSDRSDYNIVFNQDLDGELDISRLDKAIKRFVADYVMLNSHIKEENNKLWWVQNDLVQGFEYFENEFSNKDIVSYIQKPFDLEYGPLYRLGLIKKKNNKYQLIAVLHHLLIDGLTVGYFPQELSRYYNDQSYKNSISIEDQFISISRISHELFQYINLNKEKSKLFWKERLNEVEAVDLGFLKLTVRQDDSQKNEKEAKNLPLQSYTGIGELRFSFDKQILLKLNQLIRKYPITPYLYGQSILAILINRYTGQNRFGISYPIAIKEGIGFIYGGHVNTNIIVYDFSRANTILDVLNQSKEFIKSLKQEGIKYNYLPIADIISVSSKNLLDLVFLQTNLTDRAFEFENIKAQINDELNIDLPSELSFDQEIRNKEINYRIRYKSDKVNLNLLKEFVDCYKRIFLEVLEEVIKIENVNQLSKIENYKLLSQEQCKKIIYEWNQTNKHFYDNAIIHKLFEEQANKTSDNIALVCETQRLTYKQLNEQSNQLAHYIKEISDIKANDLICLCLDRDPYLIVSILAVLKTGGAYVPLDPRYPDERINYILQDTNPKIVLTSKSYLKRFKNIKEGKESFKSTNNILPYEVNVKDYKVLCIDDEVLQERLKLKPWANLNISISDKNLVYVMYTSGTTGEPKGVMMEHEGAATRILYMINQNEMSCKDYLLFKTNIIFDVSFSDIFSTLLSGAKLYITREVFDIKEIKNILEKHNISICHFVPSQFEVFQYECSLHALKNVKKIMFSGELLDSGMLKCLIKENKEILNYYGPTESGEVTLHKFKTNAAEANLNSQGSIIGKLFVKSKAYVLDSNLKPLPIGAIGELYIGGIGLARGYLNRPDLTVEKFIANPFQSQEEKKTNNNSRLYKTGDLVRWLPTGDLEYISRNDFQVKIRGYRIELGEVESILSSYEGIKQSVILAKEYIQNVNKSENTEGINNQYLVGYYVADSKLKEEEIFNYLSKKLPDYMVPNVLVHLERLPLTTTGKLDRRALPEPKLVESESYLAPRNELEGRICRIWIGALGLGEQKISVRDDFFRLGGNSILAIKLVSKLNRELNLNISVADIFRHTTVERLVHYLDEGEIQENINIPKNTSVTSEEYVLSFAQERLWFIDKYEEGTNAYNIPMVFKLSNNIKLEALEKSIRDIVSRHEILRTLIKEDARGKAYQLILDDKKHPLEIKKSIINDQVHLEQALEKEANHIYNLSNEYPIRICLFEIKKWRSDADKASDVSGIYLSIVIHHIAFDGWSINIFLEELDTFYQYHLKIIQGLKNELNLSKLNIQYKDFAVWQRNYLNGERLEKQLNYWRNKLKGHETLNLITDKPRPPQIEYAGEDIYFEIDESTSLKLRELAKELKVSLYSVLLVGYYLMLKCYSNQEDLVIGTPIANRHYSQIENMIGFFVNNLVLRSKIDINSLLKNYIHQVGDEVIEAQLHQDLPFEKLVEDLKLEKDSSRHPIFQVVFVVQSFGKSLYDFSNVEKQNPINNLLNSYSSINKIYKKAKFDISTFIDDKEIQLKGFFNFAVSLYAKETIVHFIETYQYILHSIGQLTGNREKQEKVKIKDIGYLSKNKYFQVIEEWNQTDKNYPHGKTVHQLFEEQVERTPDSIAIVFQENKLTYRQFNEKANQLANYLIETYKIKPDSLIALCLDRSADMLVSMLGVLKAGAAYVPIDPSYPEERIQYILGDTSTSLILVSKEYEQKLKFVIESYLNSSIHKTILDEKQMPKVERVKIQNLDNIALQEKLAFCSKNNPNTLTTSRNLAYIIYTSGTTGKPKGVMVEHIGVANASLAAVKHRKVFENSKVLCTAPYVFDSSVLEIYPTLFTGASLFLMGEEARKDIHLIYDYCINSKITHLFLTTRLSEEFLNLDCDKLCLNILIIGGERLDVSKIPKFNLVNEYGPTENTVCTTQCSLTNTKNISIGFPICNTKCYILNNELNPVPIGAVGELYIGGVGLARGYLNRPDLTAERFIANPFQDKKEKACDKNARIYKTGDLVRWLSNGSLEYIGRNDFQVKIRGFRIELGEIESALSSFEGIKQAVVIAKDSAAQNNNRYLIGYYVSNQRLDEESILKDLSRKLPEYMVPRGLVYLENLPLTINGKLDRRLLPEFDFFNDNRYVEPKNELEKQVCQIWKEVLGLAEHKIGIKDDFFRLGGDSIVSIQLVSKLRLKLGLNVSVKDIFSHRTIENLCDIILRKKISENKSNRIEFITEQNILSGEVPLLPIQEWFFECNFKVPYHWNQSFIIKVPALNINQLESSISRLIEYHDSFRLRYQKSKSLANKCTQYYESEAKPEKLKLLDIRELSSKEGAKQFQSQLQKHLTQWQSEFDLEKGPTYSIGYIYGYKDGTARLYFAFHHLIIDTVSWRILVENLKDLYYGKNLGPKGSSYRQWGNAIKAYASKHKAEEAYWKNILKGYNAVKSVIDKLEISENKKNIVSFELSEKLTELLLKEGNRAYHTQINDILLTALGYALSDLTKSKINYIVLEGHGREEIEQNLNISTTVGWFTIMYPLRLEIKEEIGNSIIRIKENLRQIPNKGIGYGALFEYKAKNLPKINFNYLGQFNNEKKPYSINEVEEDKIQNAWKIIPEDAGVSIHSNNQDDNIININGLVIDGKIKFDIAGKLNRKIVIRLANAFKEKLEEIISHVVNQSRSYLTVSDIDNIIGQDYLEKIQTEKEIEGVYLANSLQEGFIYHALAGDKIDDAYKVQSVWQYHSKLNEDALRKAWSCAQKKYPSLRLRFSWERELVQIIDKKCNLNWKYIDFSKEDDTSIQEIQIKKIQELDRQENYYLDQGNLLKIHLIKQKEDLYTCILSNHHAIMDGWSMPILLAYVHDTYLKINNAKKIKSQEDLKVYIDKSYVNAQRYLQENKNQNKEYWEKYILQIEEKVKLSRSLSNNNENGNIRVGEQNSILQPKEKKLVINGSIYHDLKRLSRKEGITLNSILQYIWHKTLSVYSNSEQTVVGTTVSGRNIPINEIENSVGLYINTLPLIVNHSQSSKSLLESIKELQSNINEINVRSNIKLAQLQKGENQLFDSLFVYENYPNPKNHSLEGKLEVKFRGAVEKIDYALAAIAYEYDNELNFKIVYASELFDEEYIESILWVKKTLLEQVVNKDKQSVRYLNYLNQKQYIKTVKEWNNTKVEYPSNKSIHQLFEEQVEKIPNNIALVYENLNLTYKKLNEKANQLAYYLRKLGNINPDDLVCLCLGKSLDMLISILGILKAGAAYVPIDPNYPNTRIKYILEDTNTRLAITSQVYAKKLKDIILSIDKRKNKIKLLEVDKKVVQEELKFFPRYNLLNQTKSPHLAYVIYTSGTTGSPKGVMIEHSGVVNLCMLQEREFRAVCVEKIKNFLWYSNYVFDAHVWEVFSSILNGYTLHIINEKTRQSIELLKKYIEEKSIDIALIPPVLLSEENIFKLNVLLVGGDKADKKILDCYQSHGINIINAYGPTEATVYASLKLYEGLATNIGSPIANSKLYVMDDNLSPLPMGAIGELYIGGVGLARGYLNKPDLTAEKFIPNPFQTGNEEKYSKNCRLYRTGDLVRRLSDGNLQYIGRKDFQVKIRGYRIETEAIEKTLSSYEGLKQNVVLVKERIFEDKPSFNNKYLVGYYVANQKLDEKDIMFFLSSRLPEYMVPSALVYLEKMPLTLNGKIDIKKLPEPEFTSSISCIPPRDEIEEKMCQIWSIELGLQRNAIGINDNFFRLGGNSIIAIRLISRISKEFKLSINVASIFKNNTVEKLVKYLGYNTEGNIIVSKIKLESSEKYGLSYAQERLWFIEKYEEGSNAYNIPMIYKIPVGVELETLKKSIRSIVTRHEVLRTVIKEDEGGEPYQVVLNERKNHLDIKEIEVKDHLGLEKEFEKEINHIYDLSKEHPIRINLYKIIKGDESISEGYISIVIHHIAFDGWSADIFLRELYTLYGYYVNKAKGLKVSLTLPQLKIQYKDFALWQKKYLTAERRKTQLNYWKNKLKGYETLNLATDKSRTKQIKYNGKNINFNLNKNVSKSLRKLSEKLEVSLYSVLLSGFYLLLKAYSNQNDIVIGTPVANRHYGQVEDLIGLFVNTLALRIKIDSNISAKDFIKQVGRETLEGQLHQDIPFEKIVENLVVDKDTSKHPIFQVMFAVQNFGAKNNVKKEFKDYLLEPFLERGDLYNVAKFDLNVFIDDTQESLKGIFNYATSLYEEDTIQQFIKTYQKILEQLANLASESQEKIDIKVDDIRYLNEEEYHQVIQVWNQIEIIHSKSKSIHEVFELQVEKSPNGLAVIYGGTKLTYKELNSKSNQLAHYLIQNYKIKKEELITLCLDRSEQMLIAILGILKVEGAYVPIDPAYPDERVTHILQDTKSQVMIVSEIYEKRLKEIVRHNSLNLEDKFSIISIDSLTIQKKLKLESCENIKNYAIGTNLAYIMYTSGTTGVSKGVMVEHDQVVNFCLDNNYILINNLTVTLGYSNYVFDGSIFDIFSTLLNGGKLVLAGKEDILSELKINKIIKQNSINTAFVTTALFSYYASFKKNNPFLQIPNLLFGGEKVNTKALKEYLNFNIYNNLIHVYGPTENIVFSSYCYLNHENRLIAPIGKKIKEKSLYILDSKLNPLPIKAIGELYIGGIGVARGYLDKPDLTAEKFIANPFQTEEEKSQDRNTRLYKTGDLVRWLSDGNLEYIGRNDFQVKIRGHRIELGEVENLLNKCEGIKQSIVLVKEKEGIEYNNSRYLAGYYIAEDKLDESGILEYMSSKLPEYMVPSILIHLKELPLTNNGKLDRKALPEPNLTSTQNYVPPRNDLELKICRVWAEVLGLEEEKIGISDNFFRLGGNSITAIKLISKINKALKANIGVAAIFKNNTIENLLQCLEHTTKKTIVINKVKLRKAEKRVLSFAQERLWFIEKYEGGTNAYNIPMVYKIFQEVNLEILKKSILNIVNRHEVLRTVIREDAEGKSYQVVLNEEENPLAIEDFQLNNYLDLEEKVRKQANYIYSLSSDYPIVVNLYNVIREKNNFGSERYLSIVIHHIAFDGWSIDIFLKELEAHYRHNLSIFQGLKSKLDLPKLSIQYKDFAVWQRKYLQGEILEKQLNYWKNKLEGYEALNLITDKPRPNQIEYEGENASFEIDEITSEKLRELAKELKVSLYSVLLSAYYLMLSKYSNQEDIVIGTPIANRHYSQIENLIGFFVNSLALRTKVNINILVKEYIEQVGNEVIEAQLHQDLPFEKLVEELKLNKDASRHPIFQVIFAVQSFGKDLYNSSSIEKLKSLNNFIQPCNLISKLYKIAKFDVSAYIDDSEASLKGIFNYAVSLYTEEKISQFIKTYQYILQNISQLAGDRSQQEKIKIKDIKYLNEEEYYHLLEKWNQTEKSYSNNKTISQLFEEQVKRTPNNIALAFQGYELTYNQVNEKANQLANYLATSYDIKPDTLVVLCIDRSIEMLMCVIGVLKTGAAYVPIDPSYPQERIQYILKDTNTKLILTNVTYKEKLEAIIQNSNFKVTDASEHFLGKNKLETTILEIDNKILKEHLKLQSLKNLKNKAAPNHLAYIIYTSGTTGNPKGVMQLHSNVMRLFTATDSWYQFSSKDIWSLYHSYAFDFSVWEIWGALLHGGKLVIVPTEITKDLGLFYELCKQEKITILNHTPGAFYQFADIASNKSQEDKLSSLRYVIFGGESLNISKLNPWFEEYGYNQPKLINMYGITETTVHVTYKPIIEGSAKSSISIGEKIPDLKTYVLDKTLHPLPIGAVGELYIGGAGLARGYLNRPDLTAERFVANPFQSEKEKKQNKNTRLYKTGDLVCWQEDGSLEYIGRNDFQVKVRGYRIELKDIEASLATYPGVKQCIVIVKDLPADNSSNKYLIGYYVAKNKLNEEDMFHHLSEKLPEYMVPNILVHLEKIPLTINGKLDKKALPDPQFTDQDSFISPRNEMEEQVCQIWAEVVNLDKDKVGVRDDFFRLGGNSILAIRLITKLNALYQSRLRVADAFTYRTVEALIPRLIQTKNAYQPIFKLNNSIQKKNLFMIHPGTAGCEVYMSLSNALADCFSCYGIDSYNLYHEQKEKIIDLHQLSKYYLSYIEEIMDKTQQSSENREYYLLGWSLGGQIALEIASILEEKGITKIKLYILDSILKDESLLSLTNNINIQELEDEHRNYAIAQRHDPSYMQKVIANIGIEHKLTNQPISSNLNIASVLLFKAILQNPQINTENSRKLYAHISNLKYNNIDKILREKATIKVAEVKDAHHRNILDHEEFLVSEIIKDFSKPTLLLKETNLPVEFHS